MQAFIILNNNKDMPTFQTPNKEYIVTFDEPSMNPLGVVIIMTIYKYDLQTKKFIVVLKMPLKTFSEK